MVPMTTSEVLRTSAVAVDISEVVAAAASTDPRAEDEGTLIEEIVGATDRMEPRWNCRLGCV